MILNSDIMLHHPLWERADAELVKKGDNIGLFNRLIDIYIIACSIGIKDDEVVADIELPLESPKAISRNTYTSITNSDLKELLEFMLQNAIINSKTIDFDEDERIKLAFDPDYSIKNFSPTGFLTGFANYGIEKIFEEIKTDAPFIAIENVNTYLNSLVEEKYDEILKSITLEELDWE